MNKPLPISTAGVLDVSIQRHPGVRVLHRDYETRSTLVLKRAGTHKYAGDPTTEVLCCAFAVDDQQVQLWIPGDPVPPEFVEAANNPDWRAVAHGDHFETAIERHVMAPRCGWPEIPLNRHVCTMSITLALGLPARLSAAADALELAARKDTAGERLMHQKGKPHRPRQREDRSQTYWFADDDRLRRLYDYCRQDVEAERALFNRLPPLSEAEHAVWQLSCRINERGFSVDRQFAEAARRIAEAAVPQIDAELAEITGGAVTGIKQFQRLLWLHQQGSTAKALDCKTIERQLDKEDLPTAVRRALQLWLAGAQAAVKKFDALLARASKFAELARRARADLPTAVRRALQLWLAGAQAAVKKFDALLARASKFAELARRARAGLQPFAVKPQYGSIGNEQ